MFLHFFSSGFHGFADAVVGAAAADVSGHGVLDFPVAWVGIAFEQRGGAHDLARLAVAALGHVGFVPGQLDGVVAFFRKALDGGDLCGTDCRDGQAAGTHGVAVYVDGAGTAGRDAAAVLRADQTEVVAQDPQQGGVRRDFRSEFATVDVERVACHVEAEVVSSYLVDWVSGLGFQV
jgi:hypothetical protein